MTKVTSEQIIHLYAQHKSVWKVAELLSMSGQGVHDRLKKLKIDTSINNFTEHENSIITETYKNGFLKGDGTLDLLSLKLNRSRTTVCRQARKLGLSIKSRKDCQDICNKKSDRFKNWFKNNEHPKGMLGKTHSDINKSKQAIRMKNIPQDKKREQTVKSLKTRLKKYGTLAPAGGRVKVTWKQGWRIVGERRVYFRSAWEANYGRYLQWQKEQNLIQNWLHEPQTFWFEKIKRGAVTYLPDFKVINNDGSHFWVEVKGWMDARSKTKIKRFEKYFTEEKLIVIQGDWFRKNSPKISVLIKDWEK